MKNAKLFLNPAAGEGEHSKKELLNLIQSAGFECSYSSTKMKEWEKIGSKETDLIILAGGDGTIRRAAEELLDKKLLDKKVPIGLLPFGTANNIAKTLGIAGSAPEIIESWTKFNRKYYDVGRIFGLKKYKFFLEGFGYGIFPQLMEAMDRQEKKHKDSPDKSIRTALEVLLTIIEGTKPKFCRIVIDGIDYSGKFLLVEIMNIKSIGPNLHLAPLADPGDGQFEVVLISEEQRTSLVEYVKNKLEGKEEPSMFPILRGRNLQIFWEGSELHVDDRNVTMDHPTEVRIELLPGVLEFLIDSNS